MIDWLVPGRNSVVAAALNRPVTLAALGEALKQPPYQAPPSAPVLHLKPANTWSVAGAPIRCPAGASALSMGGSLGLVIGRRATAVSKPRALEYLAGLVVVNDVAIPYPSHYRPAIAQRCRDGFCPIGAMSPLSAGADPGLLEVVIEIDGVIVTRERPDYVRDPAALLADVTGFFTLAEGDILLLGEPAAPPVASPGQTVRVIVDGVGEITNPVVA